MKFIFYLTNLLFCFFFINGCAGTTYITSEPSEANIEVEGKYEGKTPLTVTVDDKFVGYEYKIAASKKGYQSDTKIYRENIPFTRGAIDTIPKRIHFILESKEEAKLQINTTHAEVPKYKAVDTLRQHWAVIVGVSKYQHSGQNGLTNLIFADDDAKAFTRSLRSLGWNESHIKLLTNEEATQRNIKIALESWLSKAGPKDQIILFWAGHGFPDPEDPEKVYFACYDTDISIPATGYRMDQVRRALEERKSKNVILLADTCHAGKLITRGDDNRGISIVPNIKKKNTPKGWIFMVGADTDRQAIEHSSWSNGAFTHSLLKGLNGDADGFQSAGAKDGVVTMGELKDYMKTSMPDETQRVLGVAKHPVITTSTGDPHIWDITLQESN